VNPGIARCRDGRVDQAALPHAIELIAWAVRVADMSATVALPRRFASLVATSTAVALPFAYIGALLCQNRALRPRPWW
jgi:hypothetical protein